MIFSYLQHSDAEPVENKQKKICFTETAAACRSRYASGRKTSSLCSSKSLSWLIAKQILELLPWLCLQELGADYM